VALTGSVMSQPFVDIAVTNLGTASCLLKGYPRIEAWGHAGTKDATQSDRLSLRIRHGVYERTDHGPRRIVLQPHDAAFFSVGTGTAYQGGLHPIMIKRLAVTLPGTRTPKMLSISLIATRPVGRRIPVGITALSSNQM
jgi:hypothetical protein